MLWVPHRGLAIALHLFEVKKIEGREKGLDFGA